MPRLIRLYITSCALGFGLAAVFVAALLGLDVAGLGRLVARSEDGLLALGLLWLFNGIVFAGVQFGVAVMRMAEPEGPSHGSGTPETVRGLLAVRAGKVAEPPQPLRQLIPEDL